MLCNYILISNIQNCFGLFGTELISLNSECNFFYMIEQLPAGRAVRKFFSYVEIVLAAQTISVKLSSLTLISKTSLPRLN